MLRIFKNPGYLVIAASLMMLLFVAGCESESDDIPSGPLVTIDQLVSDGWEEFNSGDFEGAADLFTQAANASADYLEAYLGLGYAYAQLPARLSVAQTNLDKVITFSDLLVNNGEITAGYADTLRAEAYAGMAALSLAEAEFSEVLEKVDMVDDYEADFSHRWVDSFNRQRLKLLQGEAYFGSGAYDHCLMTIEEATPGTEQAFINDGTLILVSESLVVTLSENPLYSGLSEVNLSNTNLIYPKTVEDDDLTLPNGSPLAYEIDSYDVIGSAVRFIANPVPQMGDMVDVEYIYAPNLGEFLIAIREKLDQM